MIMIFLAIYFAISVLSNDVSRAKQKSINYYAQTANENIQLIKQAFEKTALFWGTMKTADELATYGGVTEQNISAAAANPYSFCPTMNTTVDSITGKNVLYWAVAGDNKIVKRVPFIYYLDKDIIANDITFTLLNNAQHEQYLRDVSAKVYNLSLIMHILFLQQGTVNITFKQDDRYATYFIEDDKKDGIYKINFLNDSFIKSTSNVEVRIIGNDTEGNIDEVAKIKQIAVSIYNSSVVLGPDALLTSHFTDPVANLKTELGINADEDIKISIPDFSGSFSRKTISYDSPISALMWASDDKGIVATMINPFDASINAVELRSRGFVGEDIYVRYWYLYDIGVWFVNNIDELVKARIWRELETLSDYYSHDGRTVCGKPPCLVTDTTPQYSKENIYNKIDNALSDLTSDLNGIYNPKGIFFNIRTPRNLLDANQLTGGTGNTNRFISCSSSVESNTNNNIAHTDSYWSTCAQHGLCGRDHDRGCTHYASWQNKKYNQCNYRYAHRYVVKNIPVLVQITDKRYNITDSTGAKQDPTMNFFVEIDKVDDNCCNGYNCMTFTSISSANPYGNPLTPGSAIPDVNTPLIITDMSVTGITNTSATISWKSTKGATATLQVWDSAGSLVFINSYPLNTVFSQIVGGLADNETYTYTITILGASNSPYTGFFKTAETVSPPPSCTIDITSPADGSGPHTGNINLAVTVTCPSEIGNIFAGETVVFHLDTDYSVVREEVADGLTATYLLNWDSSTIPLDGNYNIIAEFTKNTNTIQDSITISLSNGYSIIDFKSVTFDLTDTTANIIAVMNKDSTDGLVMHLLESDNITDTGIVPVESPLGTYTFSFVSLAPDTRYPDSNPAHFYLMTAEDSIDQQNLSISFRTKTACEIEITSPPTGVVSGMQTIVVEVKKCPSDITAETVDVAAGSFSETISPSFPFLDHTEARYTATSSWDTSGEPNSPPPYTIAATFTKDGKTITDSINVNVNN